MIYESINKVKKKKFHEETQANYSRTSTFQNMRKTSVLIVLKSVYNRLSG